VPWAVPVAIGLRLVNGLVRPERFELPTFWFVAVNSLLILRNLRAKKRATDPSNVPNVPKPSGMLASSSTCEF
jgi:hypothetical protein